MKIYLYGHSMGGGIAAAVAARAPEMFEKVILSSPMIRPLTGGVPVACGKGGSQRHPARWEGTKNM